ncbi:MAG: leucine-rich repeat protein [Ruminococcus sp.]|nr:leucine-rich repeat protein [Ruminococcus sp.]
MKVNRILAGIMAVCVMGCGVPYVNTVPENNSVITAGAVDEADYTEGTYEQLMYRNYGDYIEISGCDETAETVVIPAEIDSVPVKVIGDEAFSHCFDLISVEIPDSIKNIGNMAFYYCISITSIEIPYGVISIGDDVFLWCDSLITIEIPTSVTNIGDNAFNGTLWFEEKRKENPLVIVNNIIIDGHYCFGDVIVPDGVTQILGRAFNLSKLTSIKLPDSITSIKYNAFIECYSLTEITILNPECDIYDDNSTISNDLKNSEWYFNGTIYGYENSTAQAYAEKYGYKFESLGTAPEKETATGDINGDNKLSIADAVLLQNCILGKQELTEEQFKRADLTGDGFVDSFDMVLLRRMIIENNK